MSTLTISGVVRAILTDNLGLSADEVITKSRARGLKAPDASIRDAVYTIKSDMKKARAKTAPAVAHETAPPRNPAATATTFDLAAVLANVALVNTVAAACGGLENARRAAEAVRAAGGVEAFLQHLDLIAGIRAHPATA